MANDNFMRLIPKFKDSYVEERNSNIIPPARTGVVIPESRKEPNKIQWVINFIVLPFIISLLSGIIIYLLTR